MSAGALRPNARSAGGFLGSSTSGSLLPLVDVICPGLAGAADVELMGMGVELGALGVSRVFNIIRSIDFVRKGPAGIAAGSD